MTERDPRISIANFNRQNKHHLGRVFPVIDQYGIRGQNHACMCTGMRDNQNRMIWVDRKGKLYHCIKRYHEMYFVPIDIND